MSSKPQSKAYRWQLPHHEGEVSQNGTNFATQLRLLNSFTREKEPFVSIKPKSIDWYSCGPTVYDDSHLGHARCYITFDIIRRILADYFGYQVFYVMNITDIDDKIIKKARCSHLAGEFIRESIKKFETQASNRHEIVSKLIQDLSLSLQHYRTKRAQEDDPAKLAMIKSTVDESQKAIDDLKAFLANASLEQSQSTNSSGLSQVISKLHDVIADTQDDLHGHTVTDPEIFRTLARRYEKEFLEDMDRLGVLPPDKISRVSDYIEEIGLYVKQIEKNGFAYRAGGSVYFDVEKFDADPKHYYAKLVREAVGHKKSLDEGEGELSCCNSNVKRSPGDFALWKKSKPGEPSWKVQDYEPGRPGWHIECSVMASNLLGANFDMHSGGCDLKFPHHDNEIAQAEAYNNDGKPWVNYFVHSGHLSIKGCKMSKSLKNFITIRQALRNYSSRQVRFLFLTHNWIETLDYSPDTMNTAISYEKTFKEFFVNLGEWLKEQETEKSAGVLQLSAEKLSPSSRDLNLELKRTVESVEVALCDNFNTKSALDALRALVKVYNKQETRCDASIVEKVAKYVHRILSIFGANFDEIEPTKLNEVESMPLVEAVAHYRAGVRRIASKIMALGNNLGDGQMPLELIEARKNAIQILNLSDNLRDRTLPDLGAVLEDKEGVDGKPFIIKFISAEERALIAKVAERKRIEEEAAKLAKLKLQQERDERAKVPPSDLFRNQTDKFSKFDESGMPTHDAQGKEISKSALKKLQRQYAEQEARHKKYLASLGK